jgi:Uncharacterized membrane-associated protein
MQLLVNIAGSIGIFGLILVMAVEGASVPFPGIVVILALGYILRIGPDRIPLIAAEMGIAYSAASYIPYLVGMKLETVIRRKYEKEINKAQGWFYKYGEYTIALLRPFALGNYISYIAGISRVKPWKYVMLTFAGIYPWCFAVLTIAHMTSGNVNTGIQMVQSNAIYAYIIVILITVIFVGKVIYQRQNSAKRTDD